MTPRPFFASFSKPEERDEINALLREALQIPASATALHEQFQQWKYWGAHPWLAGARSRILRKDNCIAAHVCMWPIRLATTSATCSAFHPIDWSAKRSVPGAGLHVLRNCFAGMDAAFSIGGSEMTQKILPAFGFKPQNKIMLFTRPLQAWEPAWTESPRDIKMPARLIRNYFRHAPKSLALKAPWSYEQTQPEAVPNQLWPQAASAYDAVSIRNPELLRHIERCPEISRASLFLLRNNNVPAAYFFLVRVRNEVRLADYGPANLDSETSRQISMAAQAAAHKQFAGATGLLAATAEDVTAEAWLHSGLISYHSEPIRVSKLNSRLNDVTHFRLTLLDWDLLCL